MWRGMPFACQRRPIIGVLRMCRLLPGSFDCFCCPHNRQPPHGRSRYLVLGCIPFLVWLGLLQPPGVYQGIIGWIQHQTGPLVMLVVLAWASRHSRARAILARIAPRCGLSAPSCACSRPLMPPPPPQGRGGGGREGDGTRHEGPAVGGRTSLAHGRRAVRPPCVTFRLVVAPLRGPGRSPVLPFACCVGSLLSVGRCGRCSCWCRFRVCGAQ